MNNQDFDLNDIENEPTDAQLNALMTAVVIEARKKAFITHEQLMDNLLKEINRVNHMPKQL